VRRNRTGLNTLTVPRRVVILSEEHPTTPAPSDKPSEPLQPLPETTPAQGKPAKPSLDFPLFPHAAGVWAKKIRGKLHYFGPWSDPDGALRKYNEQKDDLHAGRSPRPDTEGVTVKNVVSAFLTHKMAKMEAGELSVLTLAKYKEVTDLIISAFSGARLVADLRPDDFTALKKRMTKRWGPLRVADFIQHIRSVFKHALDSGQIDRPARFGPGFDRPAQQTLRLHRARQGAKLFTAEQIRKLLGAADTSLKAMILLGINVGFGNADCANLPLTALDLERGWLDYPRPKTGIGRRCPLWPETVLAIREALAKRPTPKPEHAGLVFISRLGTPWCSVREKNRTDGVAVQMTKLLRKLEIDSFRTVADEAKDQPAADSIMGHEAPTMASVYPERISDERLKAVSNHVRAWLFGIKASETDAKAVAPIAE
jgi:integrase